MMTEAIDYNGDGENFTDNSQDVKMTRTMQPIPKQSKTQDLWAPEHLNAL